MPASAKPIDVRTYLISLEHGLSSADVFIPIPFAASILGVEQTTVRAYVRSGQLDPLLLTSEYDEKWSGVSARSLLGEVRAREKVVNDLVEPVMADLKALGGELIEYGVLMPKHGLSANNPHHRGLIAMVLGEISTRSWNEHDVLLSAQVVRKDTKLPSEPFFDLAIHLGAMEEDEEWGVFMKRHIKKIRGLAAKGRFG